MKWWQFNSIILILMFLFAAWQGGHFNGLWKGIYGKMINNETVVTAGLFGVTAGITTQSMVAILVGAIAVGVVQPFFRVLWTNKLNQEIRKNKCPSCKRKKRKN